MMCIDIIVGIADRPTSPDSNRFNSWMIFLFSCGSCIDSVCTRIVCITCWSVRYYLHLIVNENTLPLPQLHEICLFCVIFGYPIRSKKERKKEIQLNENENENSKMCNQIVWQNQLEIKWREKNANRRMETAQHTYMHIANALRWVNRLKRIFDWMINTKPMNCNLNAALSLSGDQFDHSHCRLHTS